MLKLDDWSDPLWRLSNLYHVTDENGRDFAFKPNEEQLEFYRGLWYRNDILKARQLGFTTLCSLLALDQCMWNTNFTAVQIAHTLDDAGKIFRNKVQYAYEHLPAALRERIPLRQQSSGKELLFKNGSSVSVTTSARGGTTQFLHVSEFGKIARRYPEKAREIVTGAFESVPASGIIVVESTAEGNAGPYYDMTMEALDLLRSGRELKSLEFRLHFFPWYRKSAYAIDPAGVSFSPEDAAYFDKLERMFGIKLSMAQRAWYVLKRKTQQKDMLREYPSTPEEAFEQTVEGAIYAEELEMLRRLGRIGPVPIRTDVAVNTFWDLGASAGNATAVWFHQRWGTTDRFIHFDQKEGKGMRYFFERMIELQREHGFRWGTHHLPHDGKNNLQGAELTSRVEILETLINEHADLNKGFYGGEVVAVPRTSDLELALQLTKRKINQDVYFDERGCAEGLRALQNYQYEWNEAQGRFSRNPLHNWCSNPADAFRQWATGYDPSAMVASQGRVYEGRSWGYVRGGY
jgi:hypothetical protein